VQCYLRAAIVRRRASVDPSAPAHSSPNPHKGSALLREPVKGRDVPGTIVVGESWTETSATTVVVDVDDELAATVVVVVPSASVVVVSDGSVVVVVGSTVERGVGTTVLVVVGASVVVVVGASVVVVVGASVVVVVGASEVVVVGASVVVVIGATVVVVVGRHRLGEWCPCAHAGTAVPVTARKTTEPPTAIRRRCPPRMPTTCAR
jgi:hypothetical protein